MEMRVLTSAIKISKEILMKLTRVTNDPSSIRRIINNKAAGATNAAGKESACNAGDPGSIPGLGRSTGEGIATHFSILGLPLWLRW